MIDCDLCGKPAQCIKKEIDGKEFHLCDFCWSPLAEKLNGKGQASEALPHRENEQELEEYDEISIY